MSAHAWLLATALALAAPAYAQHPQTYSGQQGRAIKALSEDEVKQHLAGAGMGYAKAAELNHYPGPMHALELADKLNLSADQRRKTEALMQAHKSDVRALGGKVVEAERALDAYFAAGTDDAQRLAALVRATAAAQGEYRLSHLETHRRMKALLTPEQVARYDALRGYTAASHTGSRSHAH